MTLPRLIALLSAAAAGLPGAAFAFCGDAAPDPGETCDDGNNDAADGCSPACVIEYGYTCDLPTGTLSGVGVNLSFESDDAATWDATDLVPGNQVANSLTPTGWTIGPNPVDILLNGAAGTVMQDGGQAVRLAGVLGPAYIEQNIPVPADRQYRISYSWARSAVDCRFNNEVGITVTVESADRDGDDADFDAQRTQLGTDELVWPTGSVSVRAHSGSIRMLVSGSSGVATYCGPVLDDIEITRASTCDPIDSDGDSLTDLEEDLDGDGQVDAGESDPNDEDSDDDGLSDFTETRGTGLLAEFGRTDPTNPDTDGDGVDDGTEVGQTIAPSGDTDPAAFRPDTDSTTTTNPLDDDSDDDGLLDGTEDANGDGRRVATETDPNNPDSDGDLIQDGTERGRATPEGTDTDPAVFQRDNDIGSPDTDPLNPDTDGGGIPDGEEDLDHDGRVDPGETDPTDPIDDDADGDGLTEAEEDLYGTLSGDADSDNDGLSDLEEVRGTGPLLSFGPTSPTNPDTDGDGLLDGTEVGLTTGIGDTDPGVFRPDAQPGTTTDPTDDDHDDDGLFDGTEDTNRNGRVDLNELDNRDPDTDDDGIGDGTERGRGTPEGDDTNRNRFIPDLDPGSTTNPLSTDTDRGGIADGDEDPNHNGLVEIGETNPNDPSDDDSDGDGISDAEEEELGTDPFDRDSDNDGLNDDEELRLGTDPTNADTDGEGLSDGAEVDLWGTDPNDPDTDDDRINDYEETRIGTNPLDPDEDNDGLTDQGELVAGTDPRDPDTDNDGLLDGREIQLGTDPTDADSDDDGLTDAEEVNLSRTDPNDADTDDDALLDAEEIRGSGPLAAWGPLDPLDTDTDNDGLTDGTEVGRTNVGRHPDTGPGPFVPDADPGSRTDPDDDDTDDDGLVDGQEDQNHNGRRESTETDPLDRDTDNDQLTDGLERGIISPEGRDTDPTRFVPDGDAGLTRTDPLKPDTDDGGVPDWVEDFDHDGAFDEGETDPNDPSDDAFAVDNDGDGLPDGAEDLDGDGVLDPGESAPDDFDTDDDGIGDYAERFGVGVLDGIGATDPGLADTDGDGVDDGTEIGLTAPSTTEGTDLAGFVPDADPSTTTDPLDADTDDDRLPDGTEDTNGDGARQPTETDPLVPDTDGDGLPDGTEDVDQNGVRDPNEMDPLNDDSDSDGFGDATEDQNANGLHDDGETDPLDADTDDDGLMDATEDLNADHVVDPGETDPLVSDSDNDGLPDGLEQALVEPQSEDTPEGRFTPDADPATTTDPNNPDVDGDGLLDGDEDANHNGRVDPGETDPNEADFDSDGLDDGAEGELGTDPFDADSDNDGFKDGFEVDNGTNPRNAMRGQGSAGCAHTSGVAWLGLLALPLLRRRAARAALAAAAIVPAAQAQDKPALDAQRFDPVPQLRGFTLVRNELTPRQGSLGGQLAINYGMNPLELGEASSGERVIGLVDNLLGFDLGVFGAATDWLTIGATLPVLQLQFNSPEASVFAGPLGGTGKTAGIGDLTLDLAFQPLRQDDDKPLSVGVIPRITFPTGSRGQFLGSGAFRVGLDVALGRRWEHFRFSAGAGYHFQSKSVAVSQVVADDEVRWQVGLGVPLLDDQLEIQVEYVGATVVSGTARAAVEVGAFSDNHMPMELLLAAQYAPKKAPLWVTLGAGRGLTYGFGDPDVRVFANVGLYMERTEDSAPQVTIDRTDDDKDGIIGEYDACPTQREDRNGFEDDDGCPDNDEDFDGVTDDIDQCPRNREDVDLYQDADGCPEPDNDFDEIEDVDDDCPKDKEIVNGLEDEDGCPDDPYASVDRARGEIVIAENIYFETNTATIKPTSTRVLESVATLIIAYPSITLIEVAGHTDTRGDPDKNLTLSQQRAEAVVKFLVGKGVAPERLQAKGYGSSEPIVPDAASEADHAINRRVEFRILTSEGD
jgi:cysteine-rich repeat protein